MGTYEEALLRLRIYWQQHQTDEDALRVLLEMLGERERYQEAERYYEQAREALECDGREPDLKTQDVMQFVRIKPIQGNTPLPSVKESGQRLWSHVPLHTVNVIRPELRTSFVPSTNESQKEVSLFFQSLRYAIIEAVRGSGETLMHSMSAITEKDDMDRKKRDLLKLLGTSIESQRHIDLAEQALMQKDGMTEMSNCSSNTTSVTSQKGVNAVLLKDYHQALTLLDTG
jgi:hypothetical protein